MVRMEKPQTIVVAGAAPPAGHYSAGMRGGGMLFVSGQLAVLADGNHAADRPFEEQAAIALENVLRVLSADGLGPSDVVKVTAYIVGIDNWPAFNRVYAEIMGSARPARAVVPVPELHHGYLVEIEAIAICSGNNT
jgi:2-iminobutanoate/2-iminopropanoate deaminase